MARLADPGLAERRRRQIIDAAMSCFRRRGFHQATMQEICAEAALSAGAVYRYFPSKTDIIAAIADHEQRRANEDVGGDLGAKNLIDSLCVATRRFVDMTTANGDAPVVADVISEAIRNPEFAARLQRAGAPRERNLVREIKAGQRDGLFDATLDPERAARIVLGLLDGLRLRARMRAEGGTAAAADVRIALERLLRPPSAASPNTARRSAPRETVE